jgi:hypothetical protein
MPSVILLSLFKAAPRIKISITEITEGKQRARKIKSLPVAGT